jgi:hypothetical protein
LANGFLSFKGLVTYKRPFHVVGAERQESFIVAWARSPRLPLLRLLYFWLTFESFLCSIGCFKR